MRVYRKMEMKLLSARQVLIRKNARDAPIRPSFIAQTAWLLFASLCLSFFVLLFSLLFSFDAFRFVVALHVYTLRAWTSLNKRLVYYLFMGLYERLSSPRPPPPPPGWLAFWPLLHHARTCTVHTLHLDWWLHRVGYIRIELYSRCCDPRDGNLCFILGAIKSLWTLAATGWQVSKFSAEPICDDFSTFLVFEWVLRALLWTQLIRQRENWKSRC